MVTERAIQVFVSSPSDVGPERLIAQRVVDRVDREFSHHFRVRPVLWEHEPLPATAHFQTTLTRPSDTDIAIVVVWSQLGVPLPADEFPGPISGGMVTGTEWEFEEALKSYREHGHPDLLFYRKLAPIMTSLSDDDALEQQRQQKKAVDDFVHRWFVDEAEGSFKAAYHTFEESAQFEALLETHLSKLLEDRLERFQETPETQTILWRQGNPYRGLAPFEIEHAPVFCGRTRARKELRQRLAQQTDGTCAFTLVLGASGIGKSSLVKAGLLPDLMLPGMVEGVSLVRAAVLEPVATNGSLIGTLADALLATSAMPELEHLSYNRDTLIDLLQAAPGQAALPIRQGLAEIAKANQLASPAEVRLAVVIDQLEELFRRTEVPETEQHRFAMVLETLANSGVAWVVATMRSDLAHHLQTQPILSRLSACETACFVLSPPNDAEISQIVGQPATATGLRFEIAASTGDNLQDIICRACTQDPTAVPLIELALHELWEAAADAGSLTYATYQQLGGVEGILGRHAERVFMNLPRDQQAALPTLVRALMTVDDNDYTTSSRVVPFSTFPPDSPARELVDAFLGPSARLLAADRRSESALDGCFWLAHDALKSHWTRLADEIQANFSDIEVLTHLRRSAARWKQADDEDRDSLLLSPGLPLSEARMLLDRLRDEVEPDISAYVEVSTRAERLADREAVLQANIERLGFSSEDALSGFAGRAGELRLIERCWQDAEAGAITFVNIVGDAGIGKSRLAYEFIRRHAADSARIVQGHCTPDGMSTPLLPFIEIVRSAFGIRDAEDEAIGRRKLVRGIELLGITADQSLPYLENLLGFESRRGSLQGLDGAVIGARTRDILQEMLYGQCRLLPTIMLLEDLQWIDSVSEEMLQLLATRNRSLPLLVISTFRNDYDAAWRESDQTTEIFLRPLAGDAVDQIVQERLGDSKVDPELPQAIASMADGNPLYAEEITRYAVVRGDFAAPDHASEAKPRNEISPLPDELKKMLMARVDGLDDDAKSVLQAASILGPRFPVEVMQQLSGRGDDLTPHLSVLESEELLFREQLPNKQDAYRFKHAMIRDTIYDDMVSERRQELHQQAATAIETLYAERVGQWSDTLAHHFGHASDTKKAVRYMALSGEKSLRVYALNEAEHWLRQSLELADLVPGAADVDTLADILINLAKLLTYRRRFTDIVKLLEEKLPSLGYSDDKRRRALISFWLGFARIQAADFRRARSELQASLALAEEIEDPECIAYACLGLAWLNFVSPQNQASTVVDEFVSRALEAVGEAGDIFVESLSIYALAVQKTAIGEFKEARLTALRLVELGRNRKDARAESLGHCALAWLEIYEQDFEKALDHAEHAVRTSSIQDTRLVAQSAQGAAIAFLGRPVEGLGILADVRQRAVEGGFLNLLIGIEYPYGAATAQVGKLSTGIKHIEDTIDLFTDWGNDVMAAIGHLTLGQIYLELSMGEQKPSISTLFRNLTFLVRTLPFAARKAEVHLRTAARTFRKHQAEGQLARCLVELSLLLSTRNQRDEANACLSEARLLADRLAMSGLQKRIAAMPQAHGANAPRKRQA